MSDTTVRVSSLHGWTRILSLLSQVREIRNNLSHPSVGASAFELYDIAISLIQDIFLLVSDEHFRNPRKNPGIRVYWDKVDILGNTLHQKVVYPRYLTDSDPEEVQGLNFIIENLISLRRNRRLSRTSNSSYPGSSSSSRKGKRGKPVNRKARRNSRRWYYK